MADEQQEEGQDRDNWLGDRLRDLLFSVLFVLGLAFVLAAAVVVLCAIPFFLGYLIAARLLYWLFERFWMWVAPGSAGRVHTWPALVNFIIYAAIGAALYFGTIGFAPGLIESWIAFLFAKARSVVELLGMAQANCGWQPNIDDGCVRDMKWMLQGHHTGLEVAAITLLALAALYDFMGKTDTAGRLMMIERRTRHA
ncbi:hypothetical protein [Dongia sedimenti]|uniref:Uncharacterized protein n=1 Tax=Dongia sedimenti TaxID=3064282 RepID=A0ABU0YMX7_9PROT|nr:hypothetical protein [Rhodospirillaceae bacterium R-7]